LPILWFVWSISCRTCPLKKKTRTLNTTSLMPIPKKNLYRGIRNYFNQISNFSFKNNTKVLIDSGSKLNLIDVNDGKNSNILYNNNNEFQKFISIGGKQAIYGITPPLNLRYFDHLYRTRLYIADLPHYSCILVLDWLKVYNPNIDFLLIINSLSISRYCISHCITRQNQTTERNSSGICFPYCC